MDCITATKNQISEEHLLLIVAQLWNKITTLHDLFYGVKENFINETSISFTDQKLLFNENINELMNRRWVRVQNGYCYLTFFGKMVFENRNAKLSLAFFVV